MLGSVHGNGNASTHAMEHQHQNTATRTGGALARPPCTVPAVACSAQLQWQGRQVSIAVIARNPLGRMQICSCHQERNGHVQQLQVRLPTIKLHVCSAPVEVAAVHVQRRVVIFVIFLRPLRSLLTAAGAAAMPLVSAAPAPRRGLRDHSYLSYRRSAEHGEN